jgi:methylglutaconyl-CoA hydratase
MGLHSLASLSLNPKEWKTAHWGKGRGLYNEVFTTQEQADAYLETYLYTMVNTSQQAMTVVKRMLWESTSDWDSLLTQRAEQSAKLLLTNECKTEIAKFLAV